MTVYPIVQQKVHHLKGTVDLFLLLDKKQVILKSLFNAFL